ncbi:MAG: hypothetical protein GFH27_549293n93 [Chloroflexi bacterium AL-W]|nr:hypothetical protein [Chloroflexi bacterium AL-N1]NOK67792.1 hypothetical protein [Chloroflexi bacterium AL-N10]NOK75438.1 hypothetical protein [Chloroflexi bacterium AL-N5]NOK82226.1 hypothetical protein [Chloroflexi bacterium AL-W]NOK90071.1 hypothetical protein [Chloroflexi bacterium AL-N15]
MSDIHILLSTRSQTTYQLGGAFRIGTGQLYEAYDQHGQRYWVKYVAAHDEAAIARLRYEAIILGKLQHNGIIRLLDRGRNKQAFFLVLAPAHGRSLADIAGSKPIPVHTALNIAIQLTDVLNYLHGQGIICRTLTPASLYLDHLGRITLIDLSDTWDEISPPRTGDLIINASYLSPEEAGGAVAERRSDIYVYGILLFELLAGHPPFQSANRGDLALQHLLTPPPNLEDLRPDVPTDLAAIVRRCLAKSPGQRYNNTLVLQEALNRIGKAEAEPLPELQPTITPWRWLRRQTNQSVSHTMEGSES